MACAHVKSVSFAEIEARLQERNPSLVEALATIFVESAAIVERGHFRTPCRNADCSECANLLADCSYSHIPLAVILRKSVEVCIDAALHTSSDSEHEGTAAVPLRILGEGDLFGVFETLHGLLHENDERPPWSVSSGARSIWIVAPLKDKRIPELFSSRCGCQVDWMRDQSHWRLVQEAMAREGWQSEVLFIGRGVIDRVMGHQSGTDKLFELILATGWRQSAALRNSATIEASLRQRYLDGPANSVSSIFGDMYLFATVCHLFAISRGDAPAFEPAATARHDLGPFAEFERGLHQVLKAIKREEHPGNGRSEAHYPVVLQPVHLNASGQRGFYSFRCPSLPGLKLPRVASYAEVPTPVKSTVEKLASVNSNAIDLKQTSYFTQAGRFDLRKPESGFRWEEFLGHVSAAKELYKRERLFLDSQFLVSGVRIVRSAPR
jgi:hypothetical protein